MAVPQTSFSEVLLVVFFRAIKALRRNDLGRYGTAIAAGSFLLHFGSARDLLLFRRVIENRAAILGADVGTLAIELCRVVRIPKYIEQLFIAHFCGFVLHLHDLRVAGAIRANLFIRRIGRVAAFITDRRVHYTINVPECRFYAPEASGCECCFLDHHFYSRRTWA